jgi:hypothetical protein
MYREMAGLCVVVVVVAGCSDEQPVADPYEYLTHVQVAIPIETTGAGGSTSTTSSGSESSGTGGVGGSTSSTTSGTASSGTGGAGGSTGSDSAVTATSSGTGGAATLSCKDIDGVAFRTPSCNLGYGTNNCTTPPQETTQFDACDDAGKLVEALCVNALGAPQGAGVCTDKVAESKPAIDCNAHCKTVPGKTGGTCKTMAVNNCGVNGNNNAKVGYCDCV